MRRRFAAGVLAVVAAVVIMAGASPMKNAIGNVLAFGTFGANDPPPRVEFCGRRYLPGGRTNSRAEVDATLADDHLQGLTRIGTAPSGAPVVAGVMSPVIQAEHRTAVCSIELWVQTGNDAYAGYVLSGGP